MRYASHQAELTRSREAYEELARAYESLGDSDRAAACRRIGQSRK